MPDHTGIARAGLSGSERAEKAPLVAFGLLMWRIAIHAMMRKLVD